MFKGFIIYVVLLTYNEHGVLTMNHSSYVRFYHIKFFEIINIVSLSFLWENMVYILLACVSEGCYNEAKHIFISILNPFIIF